MRHLLFLSLLLYGLHAKAHSIHLKIDYNGYKPSEEMDLTYEPGTSVLQLLQSAVKVSTKKVGPYLFIRSINGVQSSPKKMGWFYKIDGKKAAKTASNTFLHNETSVSWEFRADHCLSN